MEKLRVGFEISNSWFDPPITLMAALPLGCFFLCSSALSLHEFSQSAAWSALVLSVCPWCLIVLCWKFLYHDCWMDRTINTNQFLTWRDPALQRYYSHRRIPMAELYEMYIEQKFDWNVECEGGDCLLILQNHRHKFVNYKFTAKQLWWLVSQFLPPIITGAGLGTGSSSGKSIKETTKEIDEHYNKGNSVFAAMLGPSMTYTCGIFDKKPGFASDVYAGDYIKSAKDGELERAQHRKFETICNRLHMQHDQTFLDIGCGWGTLSRHACRNRGTEATAVTLSVEGRRYCNESCDKLNMTVNTLLCDYRDMPMTQKFDNIASIEMAEHVGLHNFCQPYLSKVKGMMKSHSSRFFLQVSGIKQGANWEDMAWGLFMSKYIFPGADASTPLNWYIKMCERAGFEIENVHTVGRPHYSYTLHKWYDNWMAHREEILNGSIDAISTHSQGVHMFRLQEFFLGWSVIAAAQGSASCYQIVMRPNTYDSIDVGMCCHDTENMNIHRDLEMKKICVDS